MGTEDNSQVMHTLTGTAYSLYRVGNQKLTHFVKVMTVITGKNY